MKAQKHSNGYWQSFYKGKLICAALFKLKRDAIALSNEFETSHIENYTHVKILVKKHNGFFV